MKCIFYCASLFLLASGSVFAQKSRMNVFLQQNELMFNVSYNNRPVIENSSLGIIMTTVRMVKILNLFLRRNPLMNQSEVTWPMAFITHSM